jgi:PAS domain S-box-containing protein
MPERTLSQHILSWTLPFVLAVGALISVSTYLAARRIIVQQLEHGARQQAASAAAEVKAHWEQDRNTLLTVAQSPLFVDYAKDRSFGLDQEAEVYRQEIERMLLDLSERVGWYPRLRYVTADGAVAAWIQDGKALKGPRGTDAVALAASALPPGQARALPPETADWHKWPVIPWRVAVVDRRRGVPLGVLEAEESLSALTKATERFQIGESGRVSVSADGSRPLPDGGKVGASASVAGTPFIVTFTVDRGEFVRPLWLVGVATLALGFFSLLLLAVGLTGQLAVLLRPIQALADAALALASGKHSGEVPTEGPREVSQLARAFNAMTSSLRQRTEDLVKSEERYRGAVENHPHAVVSLDQNLRVTLWNRRAEALFGYQPTEAFGRSLSFVLADKDFERLTRQVETEGSVRNGEAAGVTRDGRRLDLTVSWTGQGSPQGAREWFVVLQDETEKKRLHAQLIQAEKLSAVGTLIAGVAHELNNPLAAVMGYAEMILHYPHADPEEKEDLRQLGASARRCKDIVQGLLSFVRQGKTVRQRISLNYLVHATIGLLEYRLVKAEGITLDIQLDGRTPHVAGDFSRLQQILVNLLTNAADAMRGQPGARVIRVRTRRLQDGSEVEIEDTGPGLAAEVRARLFEPFVTTKPVGVGTGLGLSISSKTAQEFGGSLRHEDAPGGGARFVVRFPACPAGLQEADSSLNLPPPRPGTRVLVVDDEPDLAQLIRRVLAEDGMDPVAAADLETARRALSSGAFDLVVSDIDLGPTKGFALFDELSAAEDRPAFLFVTGDVLNEALLHEAARRDAPVLTKPFLRTDLLRAVRRAAAAAREGRP